MLNRHRLTDVFLRFLALGVICCGGIIIYSSISFRAQSNQPFQENLLSLSETIKELDLTVVELRKQSKGIDSYLGVLQDGLAKTKTDLKEIDLTSNAFLALTGGSTEKILKDASGPLKNASELIRRTADFGGAIPGNPLKSGRGEMYSVSSDLKSISETLDSLAKGIARETIKFRELTSSSITTVNQVVESTEEQISILRKGPVERIPVVLEALSDQLSAHVKLIDASYNLLDQISLPVIAVGLGFVLLGLRGVFMPKSAA